MTRLIAIILFTSFLSGCVCGQDFAGMKPGIPYHQKDVPWKCFARKPIF